MMEKLAQESSSKTSNNNKNNNNNNNYSSGDEDLSDNKRKLELAWVTKAPLARLDGIIPRLSAASLARLSNEILRTYRMSVVEKEDWKSVIGLVINAKQVSSVRDVAQKLFDYAKFGSKKNSSDGPIRRDSLTIPTVPSTLKATTENAVILEKEQNVCIAGGIVVSGSVYYLKRDINTASETSSGRDMEFFVMCSSS